MKKSEIHNSRELLVINKSAGEEVHNLAKKISSFYTELKTLPRHGLAHRLDRETSGVLLFGKNREVLRLIKKKFKERKVKKKYFALVWRQIKKDQGEIKTVMRRGGDRRKHQSYPLTEEGREATSRYEVLERFEEHSLIEVIPITGRRHQIRSQFAYLGHPVAGDKLYGFKDQKNPKKIKRHFLHSKSIELTLRKKRRKFASDLPEDLREIIKTLKCQKN